MRMRMSSGATAIHILLAVVAVVRGLINRSKSTTIRRRKSVMVVVLLLRGAAPAACLACGSGG
jgi:hypothetical protein